MTHNISESRLAFFKEYFQMGVYSTSSNSFETDSMYILHCNTPADKQNYYKMWVDFAGLLHIDETSKPNPANYIIRDYYLSIDFGDIWMSNDALVIGTGDIRNLNKLVNTDTYYFPNNEAEALIITCESRYKIRVYSTSSPLAASYDHSIIYNDPCH
jgi:hypothetical protein